MSETPSTFKPLQNKHIVLGVSGSIAAYKAADLTSKLVQAGAVVDVILTSAAARFISPLTFQALTHRPVVTDMFAPGTEIAMEHVALARRAQLLLVAPATAHTLARLALGLADDALTSTALAMKAPLAVAPAMEANMYMHPATQGHLQVLRQWGATIIDPGVGRLASGDAGQGRLADPAELMAYARWILGRSGDLAGRRLVISAGGTREPIDPVRLITNRSSGKMGHALAEAARDRGAHVTLVTATSSGPEYPVGMDVHRVRTVTEMRDAVQAAVPSADALIMAAAPADYVVADPATEKIKKGSTPVQLALVPAPDILREVPNRCVRVGFAAETSDVAARATRKLQDKQLDLMVANDVTRSDSGFEVDTNRVTIIDRHGSTETLPLQAKLMVGHAVLDRVVALMGAGRQQGGT